MASQAKSGHKANAAKKATRLTYNNNLKRYWNKLRRIRQSSGEKAAKMWMRNKPCHAIRYKKRHG